MWRGARHGSSGVELGVFRAARYFEGLPDLAAGPVTVSIREPEDPTAQAEVTRDMKHMEESIDELGLGGGKSMAMRNPATYFSSPASTNRTSVSHHEVSSSFSRGSSDTVTAAAAVYGHDLGEVVGDRRLQCVRAVRGAGGGEERWVVRCGGHALEEERHVQQKTADAASSTDHQAVRRVEDGDGSGSGSDTRSDLFEFDLGNVSSCDDLFELDLRDARF